MTLTAQQNLEQIRQKRLKWVEANKENEFQFERLLSDLYPDRAHFVYELLQNADDAEATEVHFQLRVKKLSVTHNGVRLFSEKDVESITSIGKSTKRDDINQIGKFGVGFKAVFAYTKTPQVFSGDYTFRIHDLVVPEWIHNQAAPTGKTRFDFFFDNQKPASQCFTEIAGWLNNMPDTVLLFLRYISKISWEIEGQGNGQLYRENLQGTRIVEISQQATGDETEYATHWLRFEKPLPDKSKLFVAIAYSLEQIADTYEKFDANKPITEQLRITTTDGQLFIFFPADKETTDLKFHLHAPFASTVARDSIPHREENAELLSLVAELVAESLGEIRDLGLLTTDFLEVLPNTSDQLDSFYRPIFQACLDVMSQKPLVPLHGGGHALAQDLLSGSAEIRRVVSNEMLPLFVDNKCRWVAGVLKNSRADKFLRALDIKEWGLNDLIVSIDRKLNKREGKHISDLFLAWLGKQSDEWMQAFYALLNEAVDQKMAPEDYYNLGKRLGKRWHDLYSLREDLKKLPQEWMIIRTSTNQHLIGEKVFHYDENQVISDEYAAFKSEILRGRKSEQLDNAQKFLQKAGVRKFDLEAEVLTILGRFYSEDGETPVRENGITRESHLRHISKFIRYWNGNKDSADEVFRDAFIFLDFDDESWNKPDEMFLDKPFKDTGLSRIWLNKAIFNSEFPKKPLLLDYKNLPEFVDFAVAIGVWDKVEIQQAKASSNPDWSKLVNGLWSARMNENCINNDFDIKGLREILLAKDIEVGKLIWKTLSKASPEVLKAQYRPNASYDVRTAPSQLVHLLRTYDWIPTKNGRFKKPSQVSRDQLLDGFQYDDRNGWLTAIGFESEIQAEREKFSEQAKATEQLAKTTGINEKLLKKLAGKSPEEQEKFLESIEEQDRRRKAEETKSKELAEGKYLNPRRVYDEAANRSGRTELAVDEDAEPAYVSNPERRREKISEELEQRRQNEPVRHERIKQRIVSIWEPKNKEVRDFFIVEYNGRCQICEQTFPRRSDGEPYFEAVYLIQHTKAAWTDTYGSVLCLCAQCSAKYQYGDCILPSSDQLLSLQLERDSGIRPTLKIRLIGQEQIIKFSDAHLLAIQELLRLGENVLEEIQDSFASENEAVTTPNIQAAKSKASIVVSSQTREVSGTTNNHLVQSLQVLKADVYKTASLHLQPGFVFCPECPSPVRKENLQRHLKKAHAKANKSLYSPGRCRACGKPVILGAQYCRNC